MQGAPREARAEWFETGPRVSLLLGSAQLLLVVSGRGRQPLGPRGPPIGDRWSRASSSSVLELEQLGRHRVPNCLVGSRRALRPALQPVAPGAALSLWAGAVTPELAWQPLTCPLCRVAPVPLAQPWDDMAQERPRRWLPLLGVREPALHPPLCGQWRPVLPRGFVLGSGAGAGAGAPREDVSAQSSVFIPGSPGALLSVPCSQESRLRRPRVEGGRPCGLPCRRGGEVPVMDRGAGSPGVSLKRAARCANCGGALGLMAWLLTHCRPGVKPSDATCAAQA